MTAAFGIAIGDRVGPYEITAELGSGGMGVVYRAMHALLKRPAAIKVLRPEFGGYAPALDRFLNEARATTAIRHPGIVEIYDYGHTDAGWAYIAMEFLEGASLGARLAQRGTLPLADALAIVRRIASPLAAAHEAGIVHRDLKPDNVFLIRDPEGGALNNVKLLDFGIAKLESASSRTTAGVILGTPSYMSPEQCRGITDCDHRADLYSLGCILFELLSGNPPFGRDGSMTELIAAHLSAPIPELRHPTASADVSRLLRRLLAKSPSDRPRSAGEVVLELDRCLAAMAPTAPVGRSRLRLAIATAAGMTLSLAGIGFWYRSRRAPRVDEPEISGPVRAVGTAVVRPIDAAPTRAIDAGTDVAPTAPIAIDAAPTIPLSQASDAASVVIRPRVTLHHHDSAEVTVDLGSAGTADVNTTVSP